MPSNREPLPHLHYAVEMMHDELVGTSESLYGRVVAAREELARMVKLIEAARHQRDVSPGALPELVSALKAFETKLAKLCQIPACGCEGDAHA